MDYEVVREPGQWHIRAKGQLDRGTTVTDGWLEQMGFGSLTTSNIDQVIQAATASAFGQILDPYAHRHPMRQKDIDFRPSFKSYAAAGRGTLPRTPAGNVTPRPRPRIPDRMLFRSS